MSGVEIAGLALGVAGVIGLVPVFKEGYRLARSHRERRRIRLLGQSTTKLENETHNGETMVANRYHEFYTAYGDAFARGDGIARESLKDLIIQLQHGLILELQKTPDGAKVNGLSKVVTVTTDCRTNALTAISELAQRLAVSMPIETMPFARPALPETFDLQRVARWRSAPSEISTSQSGELNLYGQSLPDLLDIRGLSDPRVTPNQMSNHQPQNFDLYGTRQSTRRPAHLGEIVPWDWELPIRDD